MLQLIVHADNRVAARQAEAEKPCKLRDHIRRLIVLLTLDHPGDRVKRIIEKMWIDLALQRIQLAFSALVLLPDDRLHQVLDPLIRFLYGISKMTDFLGAADINFRLFPRLILQDRRVQLQDRARDTHGYDAVKHHQHHRHQNQHHHEEIAKVDHSVGKHRIRQHADQLPAGVADGADDHPAVLTVEHLVVDAVLVSRGNQVVFPPDAVAELHLPRMIDQLSAAVTEIVVLPAVFVIDLFHQPGNSGKVHIYQQNALPGIAAVCQLHHAA